MAGPFDGKQGLNIDEAVASGLDTAIGGTSGLGAPTSTATASTPPIPGAGNPATGANTQTGRGFGMPTLEQPEWAWRPTQDDFGQVDVRRGQYDTGMVPTVNVQMPFSALANRQQALAQRKQALAQKVANFDRYAGLGSAPDPYVQNFGKLARGGMDQFVTEIADSMYGGDTNAATRGIMENPELMARFKAKAAAYNEIGQRAQGWFDTASDLLKGIEANTRSADEETIRLAREMVNGIGNFGTDGAPDVEKLAQMGQQLESRLSAEEAFKQVVPALERAMVTEKGPATIKRGIGGKLIVQTTERKNFDDFIDTMAGRFVANGIFETKAEAADYLNGRLGHEQVTETKLESETFTPEREAAARAKYADGPITKPSVAMVAVEAGAGPSPELLTSWAPGTAYPSKEGRSPSLVLSAPPGIKSIPVNDNKGQPQVILNPQTRFDATTGKFKVRGRLVDEKFVDEYETVNNELQILEGQVRDGIPGAQDKLNGFKDSNREIFSKAKLVEYDEDQNATAVERMTGGYRSTADYIAATAGLPKEVVLEAMKTPEGMAKINALISE